MAPRRKTQKRAIYDSPSKTPVLIPKTEDVENDENAPNKGNAKSVFDSPFKSPAAFRQAVKNATTPNRGARKSLDLKPNPNLALERARLSGDELAALYSNCIRMSTENKITQKNVWSLPLIEHFDEVLTSQKDGDDMNFQAASCTLDASVKIYSYRVDAVHNDTYKVLGGLARTSGDAMTSNSNSDEDTGPSTSKRVNKSQKVINTIESNPDHLNVKKFDLEFAVDPLFELTSAAFDEGGARGLLLNHLSVTHDCLMVFDSSDAAPLASFVREEEKDAVLEVEENDNPQVESDVLSLLVSWLSPSVEKEEICSPYANYVFGEGNQVAGPMTKTSTAFDNPAYDYEAEGCGFHEEDQRKFMEMQNAMLEQEQRMMAEVQDEDQYNEDGNTSTGGGFDFGADGGDLNFGGFDDANTVSTAFAADVQQRHAALARMGIASAGAPLLVQAKDATMPDIPSKYVNWAGIQHWKFANRFDFAKKATPAADRPKKEMFYFDFFEDFEFNGADFLPQNKRAENATMLTKAAISKQAKEEIELPQDAGFTMSFLSNLFTKPEWSMPIGTERFFSRNAVGKTVALYTPGNGDTDLGEGVGMDYHGDIAFGQELNDLDNDDDVGFFDLQPNDDDAGYDGGVGEFEDFNAAGEAVDLDAPVADNENDNEANGEMIAAPVMAEKMTIKYAKVAKRVNVKALKQNIWKNVSDRIQEVDDLPFQETLGSLQHSMPKRELQDVSVAFSFICILHLANEKGLELTAENLDTLTIHGAAAKAQCQ